MVSSGEHTAQVKVEHARIIQHGTRHIETHEAPIVQNTSRRFWGLRNLECSSVPFKRDCGAAPQYITKVCPGSPRPSNNGVQRRKGMQFDSAAALIFTPSLDDYLAGKRISCPLEEASSLFAILAKSAQEFHRIASTCLIVKHRYLFHFHLFTETTSDRGT